jgi:hypothetical protein
VGVAPSGAVSVSAAAGTVRAAVPPTGSLLPATSTGVVPTLLTPVGTNPLPVVSSLPLVGTGTLPGPGLIGQPPGH